MKAFPLNFLFAIIFPKMSPKMVANNPEVHAISIDNLTGDQKFADIGIILDL
jgi:hypothetical protein